MQLGDQPLEAEEAAERVAAGLGQVAVLHGEQRERVVAPAERPARPGGPGHQLDGVDAQRLQVVDAVPGARRRGPPAPVLGGEVVEHQLVDDQVLERQAGADGLHRRPRAADHEPGVLVRAEDVAGAGVAAPAGLAVLEGDHELVLVEAVGQVVEADGVADPVRVRPGVEHQGAGRVPVGPPEAGLEGPGHLEPVDTGVAVTLVLARIDGVVGVEQAELDRMAVDPGAEILVHGGKPTTCRARWAVTWSTGPG